MDPSALRVAARYQVLAEALVVDFHTKLRLLEKVVQYTTELEPLLPHMREAQKVCEEAGPNLPIDIAKGRVTDPRVIVAYELFSKNIHKFAYRPNLSIESLHTIDAKTYFLAILQEYELPPATRKAIEAAARLASKTRAVRPPNNEALDVYEKLVGTYRAMEAAVKDALAHGKKRSEHATEGGPGLGKMKAGPFTLVNTGGFPEKTMEEAAKVVETAAHLLSSHGLGRVCYGEILISRTVSKASTLAFYLVGKDEMFVRANLKGHEHDAVHTICHELGHRLAVMFLADKKRQINEIYWALGHKEQAAERERTHQLLTDPALKAKPGDTIEVDGKEYEYLTLDVSPRGGVKVQLALKGDPSRRSVGRISLEGFAEKRGLLPKTLEHGSNFVTPYAKTSADENFAEMIAYLCLGKLPAEQVAMLQTVL
jgi:hypothetical protein